MTLEIANETDGIVHVALYKRSPLRPTEPAVAWAIASPPPRGRAIFSIPRDYRVFARYSFSPEDPWQPVYQTNVLPLLRDSGSFSIQEVSLGRSAWGAFLARNTRGAGSGEVRIENDFALGVWCHIQLGECDVYPPRLLPPYETLIEALASPFFLAVVSPLVRVGASLAGHEIHATEIELEAGKDGVFTVHGTPCQGHRITRGSPPPVERVAQHKEAVPAKPKKAPLAPEKKKAQAKAKAEIKTRQVAEKPAKKLAIRRRGRAKTKKAPSSPLASSTG